MFLSHSSSLSNSPTIKQIIINFFNTYYINNDYYNSRIINDIIYNEKSHIVSQFKDNLITDDNSEFLKRFYTTNESAIRLPRFFEYHETYSKIYPNYTALPESKFIYKNIHRKQKIIDQQQNLEMSLEKRNIKRKNKDTKCNNYEKQVFSTDVCNSLANDSSLMRSIFGLSKKNNKHNNKNINDKHIDQDNNDMNNNNSIHEIEKIIDVIDKSQRSLNVNNTKHKKCISNSNNNHNLTTKRKQTTNNKHNGDSSCGNIVTPSHVIAFSNHNLNEQNTNTNTIINYNNNTYKIAQNQHITRLPNKHVTTLSKEIKHKTNINISNDLKLPKSSSITSNNSLVNHNNVIHRKTISANGTKQTTKEKIKVNTNNKALSSFSKQPFESENIKSKIKHLSQNNIDNNSTISNTSTINNNTSRITHRNRIPPNNKNYTLGIRSTFSTINSYNKTNHTNSTIKSTRNIPIKNASSSNIIKRLIPHSSKNRHSSTGTQRNGNGSKTERLSKNNKQHQNTLEIAFINHMIVKTKSNSQTKINDYKPMSARSTSTTVAKVNKGNKNGNGDCNIKQQEKKISVNVLNKNNSNYKSNNTSQKNINNPISDDIKQSQTVIIQSQTQKIIVKGIQIKDFGKAIGLSDYKTNDTYSDTSRQKVINVNIKNSNTKYLAQTTRNNYKSEV